ncbi:hypothetical protein PoB_007575600, partial [Plakobranchus ocellatus]
MTALTTKPPSSFATTSPALAGQPNFVSPTPSDGTVLPCSYPTSGCYFLVYSTPDNITGNCSEVSGLSPGVYVFPDSVSLGSGQCVSEILVLPQVAPLHLCLQAGFGEVRCFNVPLVNVSGQILCQNVSCNSPHGACLADPSLGTTHCVCQDNFSLPACIPVDVDPHPSQPSITEQLGPTPGGTVNCKVNIPCHFPVYTTGDYNGSLPKVTPGPRSPDINVTLDPTVRDNSTGLPGSTFLTPVTTTSAVPGQKQLCVDVGDQLSTKDTGCFHIVFTDNALTTKPPNTFATNSSAHVGQPNFISPTPPDGTVLPCSDLTSGCYFLVYSTADNVTGNCSEVSGLSPGVYVFPDSVGQGSGQCVNEVLVLPQLAPLHLCLQAGSGEVRCFNVPMVNVSGQALCQNVSCNSPHGACLADPSLGTTQCVCQDNFSLPTCSPASPQQGDLRLLGPPTGRGADGGARTHDRRVHADLRADSQATVPPTPPIYQLGLTPGGTVNCKVNIPCHFPVYTSGDYNGSLPKVTPGPRSPDINVTLDPTVRDNSTGLPGLTFLTPVTTTSAVPGQKQLCVEVGNQINIKDSGCFHMIFTDDALTTKPPNSFATTSPALAGQPHFVSPTPPDGTVLPCSDPASGCYFLVYSTPDNVTGNCCKVSGLSPGVYVFPDSVGQGSGQCVSEVLVLPQLAPLHLCLQAGSGEDRCFNVPLVNVSGHVLCQNVSCNSPHGACLADPSLGTTQCVCQDNFSLPTCTPVDVDPRPSKPSVAHQLSPTPGGTVNCKVNIPCYFPVYTTGDYNGSLPKVTPGPRSPDINMTLDPTVRDNSTGLPGSIFLTPVTTTSAVPGQKQLCVNVGDHL